MPKRYRLRFLNGSQARAFILSLENKTSPKSKMSFWQIGSDGGFLAKPANLNSLLLGSAERADVIVDFAGAKIGDVIRLNNLAALLGTVIKDPKTGLVVAGVPKLWSDDVTENVSKDSSEIWEIYNFTADAHPIHLHLVEFQVVNRQIFDPENGKLFKNLIQPNPWETGFKDTVLAYPGQITRIRAKFDIAGRYVWHCHILEQEDNEMMRPYLVK